ncbi:MAG TPA: AAA family ATPase [Thermoanaerobaculia bacterium]|jgi:Ti-type conjugative transfer relaxase TraA|nr:AAA family ATPase [Thermoanaerobaculia bacterium]
MTTFKGGRVSSSGARTGLGRDFGGLVRYLQQGPRDHLNPGRVEWSSTRNLDTDNPAEAAELMRYAASENPKVEEPVYHFGLSLAEGEHLSREQWEDAAGRVLDRMGLADHQAVLIAHNDTDNEHVHIVVNRIGDDGRAWRPFRDMVRAHEAIPAIEIEYGLSRTGRDQAPPDLSAGAVREAMRSGVRPLADRVREEAGQAFAEATSWRDLEARLAALGYRLEPAERGSGLVVTDGSRRASLSRVDRNLSGPKLAARFGETFREHRERYPEPPQIQRRADGREIAPLEGATQSERAAALIERVTSTRATFTKADVQRAAFHEPDSRALAKLALDRDETVMVGKDARGLTHYASAEYVRDEARLFTAAGELAGRHQLRLDPGEVQRALDRVPQLSDDQRAAVVAATTRDDLALIVGRAGAGKTTAAATIADAYREAGYEVVGGALAGKAADTLQQEARIHSRTLHSWEYSWGRGEETLDRRIVLVIDEAGMVDARQLSRVLDHAATHDAKVILLGDPDQLKPIGPGDAYRGLLEQHAPARLETVRRQAEPWQREASENLAGGRVAPALDAYQQAGRLHIADTRDAARAELLKQYAADRTAEPGRGQLVLAYRNDDVARLNTGIRDQRLAAGELRGHVAVAGANYAAGDRLVFLKNDHQGREVSNLGRGKGQAIGVKNGTLATLEKVSPDRFVARLDDGRRVAFSPDQYTHIAHGYAVTIHKSQGATVDRTYVLADPMMNRNASYVALTRHREGVHVYTDRATFVDREQLDRSLSRAPAKDLARDYAAAAIERHAARLAPLADQARSLNHEWQEIARVAATVENASTTARQVGEAHGRLVREAARVYRDPPQAIERLTADPRALERLSAGEAATYGQLKGRGATLFRQPDLTRQAAENAVRSLRPALDDYHEAGRAAAQAQRVASSIGESLPKLREQLGQLSRTIQRVEQAMKGPEKAIEAIVHEVGLQGARLALSALPRAFHLPVELAIRAVERVLDLSLGLGR